MKAKETKKKIEKKEKVDSVSTHETKETSPVKKRKDRRLVSGYVKLFCLFAVTVILVLLLRNWYMSSRDYKMSIPVIRDTIIHEINENEIKNYIYENPNTIIYMCTSANLNCRSFEEEFNDVIRDQKLETKITYLNLSNVEDLSTFFDEFNKEFPYDRILNDFPALVLFEEGEVVDMANGTETSMLTIGQAESFLKQNRVGSGE